MDERWNNFRYRQPDRLRKRDSVLSGQAWHTAIPAQRRRGFARILDAKPARRGRLEEEEEASAV
jgi:hypothetical protein